MTHRLLPLLLAGLPTLLPAALPTVALAAPGLSQPLVDLVPTGDVVGDGHTAATIYVVAIGTDGQPLASLDGKLTAARGDAGRLQAVSPGLFSATWTPPAVDGPDTIELSVRAKVAGNGTITTRVPVSVVPPLAHQASLRANPAEVLLGKDASSTVTIQLSGGAAGTLDGADLAVEASAGTVSPVTPLGRGQYSLLLTPPARLYPHLALVTVADRRDPAGSFGGLVVPMAGETTFSVTGLPNSQVRLRIGGQEYGPAQADAAGAAKVKARVPPGVTTATIVSDKGDQHEESPYDLKVPPTPRLQLFPTATQVPADGTTSTVVRVLVATATGQPDTSAQVRFDTTVGSIGAATHEGGGVYSAVWTPDARSHATSATIKATVPDPRGDQTDALQVQLLPALPGAVELGADPDVLQASTRRLSVMARAPGAAGVSLGVAGATAATDLAPAGADAWKQTLTLTEDVGAAVQAAAWGQPSDNPLARVVVIPSTEQLLDNGEDAAVLTVVTVDSLGWPVPSTPVSLAIARGDGRLQDTNLTTDDHGVAHTAYTAGTLPGLVEIQAATSGHIGAAGLLQLPADAVGVDLPNTGDPGATAVATAWDGLVAGRQFPRPGAAAVASALPGTGSTPVGGALPAAIAHLSLSPKAASVAPGAAIDVDIDARDDRNRAVAGQALQVFTNAGSVGAVSDKGGGRYAVRVQAPASGTDTLRITVLSTASGVSSMIEVPVRAPASAAVATSTPAEAPAQEATVRETDTMLAATADTAADTAADTTPDTATVERAAADVDRPWLRLQAGFLGGFYSYEQQPSVTDGALYGQPIAFGGGQTTPAGTAGLGLQARAWSPGTDYFGAALSLRATRYSVELADFNNALVPDWVSDFQALLLARYPVDVDRTRLHIGARAGASVGDFMVYRQDFTSATPVLDYGPLVVPAFDVGGELGVDHDGRIFGTAGATLGINGGGLYSTSVDADVGVAIAAGLYLYVDGAWQRRDTTVFLQASDGSTSEAGALGDAVMVFGGGLGWQL